MRVIDTIPHESMSITIMQMNNKFQVRFEAGPMEQIFKFSTEEVGNLEGLKKRLSPDFILATRQRFNQMFLQWKSSLD
ncbi:MAG TPA: hypothetical protein PLQ93_01675 [Bacteroidia bacterium]|nr:hypothetical protein [Bacteroidia bacterium]